MNLSKVFGFIIMALAFVYSFLSTRFHGNNLWPASQNEFITDGITLIVLAIGMQTFCQSSK